MILTGSLVNFFTIVAGTVLGLLIGKLLPSWLETSLMHAIGLLVIGISVPGLLDSQSSFVPILSMVLGTLIGELLDLDGRINRLGEYLETKFKGQSRFSEGFVTASLVFVVGAMAILGGLKSGLQNDHSILLTKSVIDGITSIVFATTLGFGVAFSAIPVLLWQGGIALLASVLSPVFTDPVMAEISFVGSLLIAAIGTNLLGITKLKIMNMTPAALLPILLCQFLP